MAKIVIDAGHGGRDPGAVWDGRQEKDDSLALALAVGEKLADRGVECGVHQNGGHLPDTF